MGNRIDLLVPGLLGPVPAHPADVPRLPALERLLARADRLPGPASHPLTALSKRFGMRSERPHDLPSAPLCRLFDDPEGNASGYWLHADPVHLRPDRDQLLLFDARHLDLHPEEAEALAAEFNAHFRADGLRLQTPVCGRWYLGLDSDPEIRTTPVDLASGRGIRPLMPKGDEATRWAALLNETQMLFHHSPVNQDRERSGRLTVSGIWPWGGGSLPMTPLRSAYGWVRAEHPFALGLARAAGVDDGPLPEDDVALTLAESEKGVLVFWDRLWPAVLDADPDAWVLGIKRLEHLAAGLLGAVARGRVERLDLDPCDGSLFRVARRELRRFWRRGPAFSARLVGPPGRSVAES
jgi:hypothetical protein